MGQIASIHELEDSVTSAFSDKVLVSHGLFPSPSPRGTHVKLEVDLSEVPFFTEWKDDCAELVVQIVKGVHVPLWNRGCAGYNDLPVNEDMGRSNQFQNSKMQESSKNVSHSKDLISEEDSTTAEDDLILSEKISLEVTKTISVLAPHARPQNASFDVILNIFAELHKAFHYDNIVKDNNLDLKMPVNFEGSSLLSWNANRKIRHANIVPTLGVCRGDRVLFIFYPSAPFTLEGILNFSPKACGDDWNIRFLVYQMVSAIAFCHRQGIVHGDLKPSNILLTDMLWCWITGFHVSSVEDRRIRDSYNEFLHPNICEVLDFDDWNSAFRMWWQGHLSNYDYLLVLNKLAGRRWGDRKFHTVMPWVIDFSSKPDEASVHGWRDLTKSKWRLAKGDEQLDFTYSTAEIPHHISDECLSELAVCIYKARRLPLFVLRKTVRSVYEPNEYPISLQRLFQWTPDECIPEFYSDAAVFSSVHAGMSDLAVPSWAQNAEEFVVLHKAALESEYVSSQLHHWIDLTFGYKLSGVAAIDAKNVTLPSTNQTMPRSQGRRQLFNLPHPQRLCGTRSHMHVQMDAKQKRHVDLAVRKSSVEPNMQNNVKLQNCPSANLESLEFAMVFCGQSRHLSPARKLDTSFTCAENTVEEIVQSTMSKDLFHGDIEIKTLGEGSLTEILKVLEVAEDSHGTYQDHLLWQRKRTSAPLSLGESCDIFALGCIIAEMYLGRPLFDPVSLQEFQQYGIEPPLIQQLPFHVQSLVLPMLGNDSRKLSSSKLLDSPFFPPSVHAAHLFVSMLFHSEDQYKRLKLVAELASHNAFLLMGSVAAKKCISFCLSPLVLPHENIPPQAFITLMIASLEALQLYDSKALVLPAIQKLLQGQGNSDVKVAILQASFIRIIFKFLGKTVYLQYLHYGVLSAVQQRMENSHVSIAASSLLVEISPELGVPIISSQIIAPLFQQFGRDINVSLIDTVVGIGKQLGEQMVVKHFIIPLRAIILTCMGSISKETKASVKSWRMLVMHDSAVVLGHLLDFLSPTTVLMELVQEPHNVVEALVLHPAVNNNLQQRAANVLLSICQCIGPDATVAYVLPRLQTLFTFDAFSSCKDSLELHLSGMTNIPSSPFCAKSYDDQGVMGSSVAVFSDNFIGIEKFKAQMDLLHVLYNGLASLLGIERLRQCITTWHIFEELLVKVYSWKWEKGNVVFGRSDRAASVKQQYLKSGPEFSPTNLLLNEIGWSVPQLFLGKPKRMNGENNSTKYKGGDDDDHGRMGAPWSWAPTSDDAWDCLDYVNRPGLSFGRVKNDQPWKLKMATCHAWRAHPGPLKAVAVGDGEATIFTAGVGNKMRGLVKQWKLSTAQSIMEYTGHEEAVNDICILPYANRGISCDGSIHMWDTHTGQQIAVFSEYSGGSVHPFRSPLADSSILQNIGIIGTSGTTLSSGMLSTGLHGSQYTCIHSLETEETLIAGTGNGYLRFFDLPSGRFLHLWQCDIELSGSSLVSAIASSGSRHHMKEHSNASSWLSVGFGLGQCRLLDLRSGTFVSSWRAHENFITKLSAFDEHYLISSSLDKNICVWDVRRNPPMQVCILQGHNNGVSSFVTWSRNLLSAGGNRIGLSNLTHPLQGLESQIIRCRKLFSTDLSNLNLSSITAIDVLPFSRFFLVATDDGYVRVCK